MIAFFASRAKGRALDLGGGQGKYAIPLARLRFQIKGVDISPVGIKQMIEAKTEYLSVCIYR
ncbi:MAG: methyltransferase domain-containing protein [Bacteroidota bacterium]